MLLGEDGFIQVLKAIKVKRVKKISARFVGYFLLIISLTGCNESLIVQPSTLGYDFYPIKVGQFRTYDVEEIYYRITGFDTTNYQLRETIIDSIPSLDQTTYLLRRDKRSTYFTEWVSDSIWTVAVTNSYVSVAENSISYIKMTFPVRSGAEWDGNSLNARSERIYYYENLDTPWVDSIAMEDQIKVIIEDIPENITGVDLRSEVFIRGVGLVEKDYFIQEKCTASNCGEDLGEVISGRSLKQRLTSIGFTNE